MFHYSYHRNGVGIKLTVGDEDNSINKITRAFKQLTLQLDLCEFFWCLIVLYFEHTH